VIDHLRDRGGFESALGTRAMTRTIARLIEVPLMGKLLSGELEPGTVVLVALEGGGWISMC
jgi:ATP-dependent Clp protease ATP-binding subunit ClpA